MVHTGGCGEGPVSSFIRFTQQLLIRGEGSEMGSSGQGNTVSNTGDELFRIRGFRVVSDRWTLLPSTLMTSDCLSSLLMEDHGVS
jgi:hypothetical protein